VRPPREAASDRPAFVLKFAPVRDDSAAAERRRHLVNMALILGGCSAARAAQEVTFAYTTRPISWQFAVIWTLPSWLFLVPVGVAAIALAGRFPFDRRNWGQSVVVHLSASVAFGLVHLAGITPIRVLLAGEPLSWGHIVAAFGVAFRLLFFLDLLTYWVIVGMFLALHYSNLRTSLAEARLAALRAQLNPHFLFNTLNAISTLALKGDHAAVTETLGRLSTLLRAALDEQTEEIPLAREVAFLDDYLAIQQIRFADHLSVEKKIASDALDGLVPTMILQPIVENAIQHGANLQRGIGHVNVTAVRENGALVIEVCDRGPGFGSEAFSAGVGLANTRARLDQLYGPACRFEYGTASGGGAAVRITIPFHRVAREALAS
jgi:two-component system LytT family sensor kinase